MQSPALSLSHYVCTCIQIYFISTNIVLAKYTCRKFLTFESLLQDYNIDTDRPLYFEQLHFTPGIFNLS